MDTAAQQMFAWLLLPDPPDLAPLLAQRQLPHHLITTLSNAQQAFT